MPTLHVSDICNKANEGIKQHVQELIREYVEHAHKAIHAKEITVEEAVEGTLKELRNKMMDCLTMNSTCPLTVAINKEIGLEIQKECDLNSYPSGRFVRWFTKEITGILV